MLHWLMRSGDWFAPKRYGFGAGLPLVWQGWALLASYVLSISGILIRLPQLDASGRPLAMAGMAVLTGLFLFITARHTRGGWRWRWGERD